MLVIISEDVEIGDEDVNSDVTTDPVLVTISDVIDELDVGVEVVEIDGPFSVEKLVGTVVPLELIGRSVELEELS